MHPMLLQDLIPILQTAIGPVILISGVGLLILSMTNRYGRIFDRTHNLWLRLQSATPEQRMNIITQLRYLLRQARLVRAAIALAALSVFFTALLIITLFLCAMLQLGYPNVVATLFICSMACLIASLTMFLADINLSLKALRIEVGSLKDKKEKD